MSHSGPGTLPTEPRIVNSESFAPYDDDWAEWECIILVCVQVWNSYGLAWICIRWLLLYYIKLSHDFERIETFQIYYLYCKHFKFNFCNVPGIVGVRLYEPRIMIKLYWNRVYCWLSSTPWVFLAQWFDPKGGESESGQKYAQWRKPSARWKTRWLSVCLLGS